MGNVVQSVHDVEHFACYAVDSFLSNVENADVPCCTQHRGAGTQEAGRAALQAQAGAGANQRPMQPSTEPRKSPQHQKSSKTGPASLHTQSSSGAQAHPRSPVRPPLGPLAARQTHEQSRLARHGGKHKTGSFVIQIFSRHCAVQKTKQPRHVDTPTLSRAASPWDPR